MSPLSHPKHWPSWLLLGLLWLLTRLPYAWLLRLGRGLGRMGYLLAQKRRRVTLRNIELCFPKLSAKEQRRLCYDSFVSLGMGLVETCLGWWGDDQRLAQLGHIEGLEHIRQAQANGQGVLLIGMHFTTLDLCGRLLCQQLDADAVYRRHNNLVFNWAMERARQRQFKQLITRKDIRGMLRSLRAKHALWYAPDQDYGRKNSVFADFFGVPAASVTASARLCKQTQAVALPISHYRLGNNQGYLIIVHPPLTDFPSGDAVADATRVNQAITDAIGVMPDQYMWQHRRFKTRPKGEASLYAK